MRTRANEVKLLKKCLKGDPKAFEVIVAKYQELVCAITYSGIADVQQSEELAHQTFINAWNKLSQLRDLSKFRPWLCNIARNHIKSFIKKKKRDILQKAKPMEYVNGTPTDESGPLESAIKKEHIEFVDAAIGQIPEQYREPLVLYYRQQQSVRQVAQSLDLSEEIVKKRLQRGRKMIKEQIRSIVEKTLSATGPKKAFTTAVIASITGMAIKGSGVAAAAGIVAGTSTTGTTTGVAAIMSGVTAKIITAAAVVVIGVGAVVTYKQIANPSPEPEFSQAGIIIQEQGGEQEKGIEEAIEQPSDKTANLLAIDKTQSGLETGESLVASPDLSAVGPLEKLAEEWQGDTADNPFAAAVSEIRKRLEEEDTEVTTLITPAQKTITCSGIVLDPNDNPIEGVNVRADLYYNGCYTEWRIFAETTAKSRTNKSGQFKLSVLSAKYGMHHILVFEHPEYRTISYHNIRMTSENMRIHLVGAKPSSVAGQVIDEEGNVIEGAVVRAQIKRHPSYPKIDRGSTVTTYTNSEGWFSFDKVYEGARLHIDAWKEGYLRYSTQSIGRDTYPVRAGMDDLLITLEPGGTIIGHLTSRGKPYRREGILVVARQTGSGAYGQAVTDKNGEFKISGLDPKRRYTLTINENFFAGSGLICKPTENIQVGAGEKSKVALDLQPGVPVTFRIIDSKTGQAVSNQFFSVVLWDPNYRETRKPVNIRVADDKTDASGRSVLMLTPNAYQLNTNQWDAQSERERRLSQDFNVSTDGNEVSVEVSITSCPSSPTLYGRFVDTEGKPVEGQVTVLGKQARSNVAGDFALSLPNQTYMNSVSYVFDKDGRLGRAFICRDVIDANQTEIVLGPLVDIVGRVVDPNGEARADALPKVGILMSDGRWYRERQSWWQTVVDKEGRFRIKGVPVGVPRVVSVTPPGNPPDVILGRLQPGKEIDVGNIVVKGEELERLQRLADLDWTGTLSGLVADEYDDPVIGTLVVTSFEKRYFSDYTDIDGRYLLTGLPRGKKLKLNIEYPHAPASYDVFCDGNDFDVQLLPTERR